MNVLIIGAGGREHALAWKCAQSPLLSNLYVTPGNDGIKQTATCWGLTDHDEILKLAKEKEIQIVVFGQEDYLVQGLSDRFKAEGVLTFGPSQAAAQLEGSKAFSKAFMAKHNIPTASYRTVTDYEDGCKFLETLKAPYVIKADGLAAGKGVVIPTELGEAKEELKKMMVDGVFKEAGETVVIEEFLEGQEVSFFIITDGEDFVSLQALQDHKRQGELDQGLNTGGMGCYAPAPIVNEETKEYIIEKIVKPTLKGMRDDGHPYQGVLYIGLMIQNNIANVVEYNIRFGDPECQTIMSLLESDLLDIFLKTANSQLSEISLKWKKGFATTVVLSSGGYPLSYEKGNIIDGLDKVSADTNIFHAGTKLESGVYQTNGGRVLSLTSFGETFINAIDKTYQEVKKVHWKDVFYRRDIGLKGLSTLQHTYSHFNVSFIFSSENDAAHIKALKETFDSLQICFNSTLIDDSSTPEEIDKIINQYSVLKSDVYLCLGSFQKEFLESFIHRIHRPLVFAKMDDHSDLSKYEPYGITCSNNESLFPNIVNILCAKYENVEARVRLLQLHQEHSCEKK